jgi:hypothetical protein
VTARQQFDQQFEMLSPEEKAELKHRAEQVQYEKTFVPKQVKRAQQHDVVKVANSFQQAVSRVGVLEYIVLMYLSLMPSIAALGTMGYASLSVVTVH